MGRTHLGAIRRLGFAVDVAAVVGSSREKARTFADGSGIDAGRRRLPSRRRGSGRFTPSTSARRDAQHFAVASAALDCGAGTSCAKTARGDQGQRLRRSSRWRTRRLSATPRATTCGHYPMVQQVRRMREAGQFGEILIAQRHLFAGLAALRDGLELASRRDAGRLAASPRRYRVYIGATWSSMSRGCRSRRLCADLSRRFTKHENVPALPAAKSQDATDVTVDTEDFGAVMFRLGSRARGAFTASQVSAGRKNRLNMKIYGTKDLQPGIQERPDELWIGRRDGPSGLLLRIHPC